MVDIWMQRLRLVVAGGHNGGDYTWSQAAAKPLVLSRSLTRNGPMEIDLGNFS
jgi:hypothetical protein